MEYRFEKTEIPMLGCAGREYLTQELTQEVRLNDGMPDVGRAIAAFGQVIVRSKEWGTGSAGVSGGVMASVLYAPEDGSEVRCVDSWIPFQMQWSISETEHDGTISVEPILRFLDCRMAGARKIMLRGGIGAQMNATYPSQLSLYRPDALPEDVALLKKTYDVRIPKETGEKTFLLDEELQIPDSQEKLAKVLCSSLNPVITECRVMTDKIVFRGNGQLHFLYKGENGTVYPQNREIPFSVFAELTGMYSQNARADLQPILTSLELDGSDTGILHLKCGMVAQYTVHDVVTVQNVEDLYSTRMDTIPHLEISRQDAVTDVQRVTVNAEMSIPGVSGTVVDAMFLPDYPKPHRTDSGLRMDHSGAFKVLYYDSNQLLQSASGNWTEETPLDLSGDDELAILGITAGSVRVSEENDGFRLASDLQTDYRTLERKETPAVIGFETVEQETAGAIRPSVVICKPGEDRLWDLAKRYKSKIEEIEQTNGLEAGSAPDPNSFLLIPVSQA